MAEIPTEVIFYSINRKFKLGADKIQREEKYSDGSHKQSAAILEFYEGIYKTSDKREIAIIKDCIEYKTGRVRIISESDQNKLIEIRANKFKESMSKQSEDKEELGYVDKNEVKTDKVVKQTFEKPAI